MWNPSPLFYISSQAPDWSFLSNAPMLAFVDIRKWKKQLRRHPSDTYNRSNVYYGFYMKCAVTHIDHPCCISLFEVIQHSSLIKVGHHGHILDLVELGRVHGEHVALIHCHNLGEKIHQSNMDVMLKDKKSSWYTCPMHVLTVPLPPSLLSKVPLTNSSLGSATNTAVLASNGRFWASSRSRSGLLRYGAACPNTAISESELMSARTPQKSLKGQIGRLKSLPAF